MKYYQGIDCGLDGGIVTIDPIGTIIDLQTMPTTKLGKGREVDILEVRKAILAEPIDGRKVVMIEDPGHHAPSASGLRSMTYSYAVARTIVVSLSLPYHTPTAKRWQGEFWSRPKSVPKGKKFDTKAEAQAVAKKIWPNQDWTPTERSKKLHDGLIDAALIAEYGRRRSL